MVQQRGKEYALTDDGRRFVEDAMESEWTPPETDEAVSATTYETVAHARAIDPEFRATVLVR